MATGKYTSDLNEGDLLGSMSTAPRSAKT